MAAPIEEGDHWVVICVSSLSHLLDFTSHIYFIAIYCYIAITFASARFHYVISHFRQQKYIRAMCCSYVGLLNSSFRTDNLSLKSWVLSLSILLKHMTYDMSCKKKLCWHKWRGKNGKSFGIIEKFLNIFLSWLYCLSLLLFQRLALHLNN